MTSGDNQMLQLILSQLSDMKRENATYYERAERQISDMRQENAEFRREMLQEIKGFKTEIRQEVKDFKTETTARFDGLTAAVVELQRDVEGLKHDVQGLYHWDYWLLSIILVVFAMPQIVAGVKALFGAITEGISGIISLFRRE